MEKSAVASFLSTVLESALVVQVGIQTCAEPQAPEGGRIMARKHGLEPVSKGKAVDPRGWREHRRAQFAPEPGFVAIALEHQAGHPEERLPEEAPANAAGDLVIDGGRVVSPPVSQRKLPTLV